MTAVNIEKVHARLDIKQPLDEYVLILGSRSSSIHYNETQESSPGGEIGRRKGLKIAVEHQGNSLAFNVPRRTYNGFTVVSTNQVMPHKVGVPTRVPTAPSLENPLTSDGILGTPPANRGCWSSSGYLLTGSATPEQP